MTRVIQLSKSDKFGHLCDFICIFLKIKIKILVRSKKSKLIHLKLEKYETTTKMFLKSNLSIVALFESYLFKNNEHKLQGNKY